MSTELLKNESFDDIDALLNAQMDDLDDLPPMGVPPSGHYNLKISMERTTVGDDNRDVIKTTFVVTAVNELKNPEDAGEVAIGQTFTEMFGMKKKDGSVNTFGIAALKERLKPFVEPAQTTNIGELIAWVKEIDIGATLKRTVNKKNEDQYNMRLSDVIIL